MPSAAMAAQSPLSPTFTHPWQPVHIRSTKGSAGTLQRQDAPIRLVDPRLADVAASHERLPEVDDSRRDVGLVDELRTRPGWRTSGPGGRPRGNGGGTASVPMVKPPLIGCGATRSDEGGDEGDGEDDDDKQQQRGDPQFGIGHGGG